MLRENGNRLAIDWGEELGMMEADLTKLRQVLLNLLSNASKFTTDGRVTLGVAFEGGQENGSYLFRITDTGIGMTSQQLERAFQPFSQADESTTREYGGTGLGLALTRRFCQMMGGNIEVASRPGEGSTFSVRIPERPPADPHDSAPDDIR